MSSKKKDPMAEPQDGSQPRTGDARDPANTDGRDDSQETAFETKVENTAGHLGAAPAPSAGPASTSSFAAGMGTPVPGIGSSARPAGTKTLFGLGDGGLPFPGLAKSLAELRAGYAESLARSGGTPVQPGAAPGPAVASEASDTSSAPDFLSGVTDALNAQAKLARERALRAHGERPGDGASGGAGANSLPRGIREASGESTGTWSSGTAARVSSWVEAEFEDPDDGPTLLTPGIISITEDTFEVPVLEPAPGVEVAPEGEFAIVGRSVEESVVIGMPVDEDSVTVVPTSDEPTELQAAVATLGRGAKDKDEPQMFVSATTAVVDDQPEGGGWRLSGEATAVEPADEIVAASAAVVAKAATAAETETATETLAALEAARMDDESFEEPPSDTQIDTRFGGVDGRTPGPEPRAPLGLESAAAGARIEPDWALPRWTPSGGLAAGVVAAASAATDDAANATSVAGGRGQSSATTPVAGRPAVVLHAASSPSPLGAGAPRTSTPLSSFANAVLPAPPLVSADGKRLTLPPGTPAIVFPERSAAVSKVSLRKASLAAIVGGTFAGGILVGLLVGRGGGASAALGQPGVAVAFGAATPTAPAPTAAPMVTVTPIPAGPTVAAETAAASPSAAATTRAAETAPAVPGVAPSTATPPPVAGTGTPLAAAPTLPSPQVATISVTPATALSAAGVAAPTAAAGSGEHVAKTPSAGAPRGPGGARMGTPRARRSLASADAAVKAPRTTPPPLAAQGSASPAAKAGAAKAATAAVKSTGAVAKASVAKPTTPKGPWRDPFAD